MALVSLPWVTSSIVTKEVIQDYTYRLFTKQVAVKQLETSWLTLAPLATHLSIKEHMQVCTLKRVQSQWETCRK